MTIWNKIYPWDGILLSDDKRECILMLQYVYTLIICQTKEAGHREPYFIPFHSKFSEQEYPVKSESRRVVDELEVGRLMGAEVMGRLHGPLAVPLCVSVEVHGRKHALQLGEVHRI